MTNGNRDAAISFLELAASGKVSEAYSRFVGAWVYPGSGYESTMTRIK